MFRRRFGEGGPNILVNWEGIRKSKNLAQFLQAVQSIEDLNKQDEIEKKVRGCRSFSDFRTFLRDFEVPESNIRGICLRLENFAQDVGDKITQKKKEVDFEEHSARNIFDDQKEQWINEMGESPVLTALFDILRIECAKYLTMESIKTEKN